MAIDYQNYEFRAYEYLVKLRQLFEGEEEMPQIREQLEEIEKEQELLRTRRFRVAVVGEFKKGKSSFINALLGKEILPVDALPATATLNRITYGAVPEARLRYKDGKEEKIPVEELARYVTKLTKESRDAASKIAEAVVEYPSVFCQNHVDLIDTPGMNDDMSMNDVTLAQLKQIDLAIVTLTSGSPFSETESRFMVRLLESDEICRIVVVVTRMDEIRGEKKRQELLTYLASQIPEKTLAHLKERYEEGDPVFEKFCRLFQDLPIFGVCSLDALEARQYNDEELFLKSGFAELNDRLPQLILTSQNNSNVLRAVYTVRRMTGNYRKILPLLLEYCESQQQEIRRWRNEFARLCYSMTDEHSLDHLKQDLFTTVDSLACMQEEVRKDFIRALASVRVLDAEVLADVLERQAAGSTGRLNEKIDQIYTVLSETLQHGIEEYAVNLDRMIKNYLLTGKGNKGGGLSEIAAAIEAQKSIPDLDKIPFLWRRAPVPGREKLLAPDLIDWICETVEISVQSWSRERKMQIEEYLKRIRDRQGNDLEKIVVSVYENENRSLEQWEEKKKRLEGPEFLERLSQLGEENQCLEENFYRELANTQ